MYYSDFVCPGEIHLAHHGVKGQKWGIRRYQNSDGSLTPAGREHYGYTPWDKKNQKKFYKTVKSIAKEKPDSSGNTGTSRKIAGHADQVSVEHLKESARKYNDISKKYYSILDKALDDAANSDYWLQKYADKFGEDLGLTEEDRKDKGLLINLFDEDPILGEDLLEAIGYRSEELDNAKIEVKNAYKEFVEDSKRDARALLGRYANRSITVTPQIGNHNYRSHAETYVANLLRTYANQNAYVH